MSIWSLLRAVNKRNAKIREIEERQAMYELQKYIAFHPYYNFSESDKDVIDEYLSWKHKNKQGTFEVWYELRRKHLLK